MQDKNLLENLRNGDASAFRNLVDEFREKVRNTCYRFVKNADDADDIAQDVFIQVFESLDNFRAEAELSTWIYRIAVNKSLDFIRAKQKKKLRTTHVFIRIR